jgi:hypothetical protein
VPCSVLRFVRAQTCSNTSSHSFSRGRGTEVRCDQTYGLRPLTGRETEPRQHEEARLGWLDRVRCPDRAIPTKPSCHSWRTSPNHISSAGSRGALGAKDRCATVGLRPGRIRGRARNLACASNPPPPSYNVTSRGSCFATLPLTVYPKFRCIQGILCVRLQHFCACDAVRAQIVPLPLTALPSAPNHAKKVTDSLRDASSVRKTCTKSQPTTHWPLHPGLKHVAFPFWSLHHSSWGHFE